MMFLYIFPRKLDRFGPSFVDDGVVKVSGAFNSFCISMFEMMK